MPLAATQFKIMENQMQKYMENEAETPCPRFFGICSVQKESDGKEHGQ